jgi:predicted RNase H-like HicB family nuclease
MPDEPDEAAEPDPDLPVEYMLTTWLDTLECHQRLASYVKPVQRVGSGRDERGQAAEGWDLLGHVDDYGFELAQRVIESPLPFDRVASGVFEESPEGTVIRFRMEFNPGAYSYMREDHSAIRVLRILSSARWAAFDTDEIGFYIENLAAILDAHESAEDSERVGFDEAEVSDEQPDTWTVTAPDFEAALDDALGVETSSNGAERAYLAVIEAADDGFSAYLPDLLGCVASGASLAELEESLAGAVLLHVNGLLGDGEPLPEPSAQARRVTLRRSEA